MKIFKNLFLILSLLPLWLTAQPADNAPAALEEMVSSYILMDGDSGQILLSLNPDEQLSPASITKLMTAYITFKALKEGRISLSDPVPVSETAYRQEGSRMFIEINSEVPVEDLIRGMIVQSGNDASVALAEHIGGSIDGFAALMNQSAQELGLSNTQYRNPTGLTEEGHFTTALDIATLSRAIINEFPEYYRYYKEKEFTWNKIKQPNRNRLLWVSDSIDGLKTGYTEAAGYCLTASEKRGDMRLISVVLGAKSENDRFEASRRLLADGFARFSRVTPLQSGQIVARSEVWKGKVNEIAVAAGENVTLTVDNDVKGRLRASLKLDAPLSAPLEKGAPVGTITVGDGTRTYAVIPAVAAEAVEKAGFFKRQWHGIKLWWKK